MGVRTLSFKNLVWTDIDEVNKSSIDYLKKNFRFHPLDFEDVLGETQRPKVDVYKNYLFLVFHFPIYNKKTKKLSTVQVNVFIGRDYLVTVHEGFKPLKKLYYKYSRNARYRKEALGFGSGFLLYKILESLFKNSFHIIDQVGLRISRVEEMIFEGKTKNRVKNLAEIKRNILNFRRIIDPQRFTINTLVHIKKDFLPENLSVYFDNIHDSIENLWGILDNYKEMVDSLFDTTESIISQRTNEVIKILTIISVALLPLTLLSGIYGMNIEGLPFAENSSSVWLIFGVMLLVIASVIVYFRKKDWF